MKEYTATNMKKALDPFRQYLLIEEWNSIVTEINNWIEDLDLVNTLQKEKNH